MSVDFDEEYTLGREVTEIALGKKLRETVVVSVRLPLEDFARLEKISSESGKSMSQVIRETVAAYQEPKALPVPVFRMNILNSTGLRFAVGPVEHSLSSCNPVLEGIPGSNQVSGRWDMPSPV